MTDEKVVPREQARVTAGLADTLRGLDLRDKATLLGTGLVVLLYFFPWYFMSTELVGSSDSITMRLKGFTPWYGKLSFLCCVGTASLIMLPNLRERILAKLGEDAEALSVPVLTAATLVIGPVFFLVDTGGSLESTQMSEGRTGWYYIAFLAAVAATASSWWKWKSWLDDV